MTTEFLKKRCVSQNAVVTYPVVEHFPDSVINNHLSTTNCVKMPENTEYEFDLICNCYYDLHTIT